MRSFFSAPLLASCISYTGSISFKRLLFIAGGGFDVTVSPITGTAQTSRVLLPRIFSTFPLNDAAFCAVLTETRTGTDFILGLTEWKLGRFSLPARTWPHDKQVHGSSLQGPALDHDQSSAPLLSSPPPVMCVTALRTEQERPRS